MTTLNLIIACATLVLLVPFAVFCLECGVAFLSRRLPKFDFAGDPGEVWVIIPAHNEALGIGATIRRLASTLLANQRILVVADNCDDDTAAIARNDGCLVIERNDKTRRGKGFALQFAFDYLQTHHAPSVVIVLDADCRVAPFTISRISSLARQRNRPVQALNLSHATAGSGGIHVISEMGFRFKNLVRPLGLARLGLPCHLMGTGMAIPWTLLRQCQVSGDHLAEDMNLGLELALLGHSALFCPSGQVLSELPRQDSGFISQRTRWEQGHLRTSLTQIPVLLKAAIRQRSFSLLALALDLTVLPFSLLVLCWILGAIATAGCWYLGASVVPVLAVVAVGAVTGLLVLGCWWRYCRQQIPFRTVVSLPFYIMEKIPIYTSFLLGRSVSQWIRTERPVGSNSAANVLHQ